MSGYPWGSWHLVGNHLVWNLSSCCHVEWIPSILSDSWVIHLLYQYKKECVTASRLMVGAKILDMGEVTIAWVCGQIIEVIRL